jgi:prepilin-type processing-associated H-X9-DG protein
MPISYAMNGCASTWYPADSKEGSSSLPLRVSQLVRPADTLFVGESRQPNPDIHPDWLVMKDICPGLFAHSGGIGNFVFYDGHAKSKKWLATLYPLTQNNWQADEPNPDPKNLKINGPAFCQTVVPPGPDAAVFQTKQCLAYQ